MNEIQNVVKRAGTRLMIVDFFRVLVVVSTVLMSLLVLGRLAQKLFPFGFDWQPVLIGAAVGSVVLSAIFAMTRRQNELSVAREVDQRAGLRATLGTAMYLGKPKDSWDHNVMNSAKAAAQRVNVNETVPMQAPARWPVPVALGLALAIVWWLPTYDVTGLMDDKAEQVDDEKTIQQVKTEIKAQEKKIESLVKKAGLQMAEEPKVVEAGDSLDPNAPTTTEELRRVALKKLTKTEDLLKSQLEGEKGAEAEAMQNAMRRLKDPGPGPASEMARAMAKGDFAEAKEQFEKLLDDVRNGDMSSEDKKKAADQLSQLKQQMEQAAQNQKQMQEQLQAAGFSEDQAKKMAASADEMQKQLQKNESMSDSQKQQMQQAANAQRKASDAMSAMSQAMGQMAQGMQNSQGQQSMDKAGEAMSGQLGDMAAMQSEMAAAQAALGECQGQMASLGESLCEGGGEGQSFGNNKPGQSGQWKPGSSQAMGSGSGKAGQGNGAGPDEVATDFMLKSEKSKVNTTDGPVIASTLVYGQQVKGESKAAFGAAVSSAMAEAAEAIDTRRIPREHEAAVREYFGRLQEHAADESGD